MQLVKEAISWRQSTVLGLYVNQSAPVYPIKFGYGRRTSRPSLTRRASPLTPTAVRQLLHNMPKRLRADEDNQSLDGAPAGFETHGRSDDERVMMTVFLSTATTAEKGDEVLKAPILVTNERPGHHGLTRPIMSKTASVLRKSEECR